MGFFQGERAKIWTFTGPKIKLSTKADLKGENAVLTIKRILYTKAELKGDNTVLTFILSIGYINVTYLASFLVHFLEAFVERQVMAHGILPPCRSMLKIGEVIQDPRVDVLHWQSLMRRVLDGHEDEAREGVGRLAVDVFLRVVRNVRGMGLVDVVPT